MSQQVSSSLFYTAVIDIFTEAIVVDATAIGTIATAIVNRT